MDRSVYMASPVARSEAGSTWDKEFTEEKAAAVRRVHRMFPEYAPTPLRSLKHLSAELGTAGIYVKDESFRFGLNAFKALGGSYCLSCYIADLLGIGTDELSYELLTSPETRERIKDTTFITATDGNHGRGIAWTASRLGVKAVVYMPRGSAEERVENIRKLGAEVLVTDCNYDDTVRMAAKAAEENGWVLVQDTAWAGYETVPLRIMQGYMTMAAEALEQMDGVLPTHVFLQSGVGAMAGALAAFFANRCGSAKPIITIVEPHAADCAYLSAAADDGVLRAVDGELDTIMAGLACGEVSTIAWPLLRSHAEHFVSMPDSIAADGMRLLGAPLPGDERVISGESGASAFGFAVKVLRDGRLREIRDTLGLDKNSRILCFSTEGATDRENYRRIIWEGAYSE